MNIPVELELLGCLLSIFLLFCVSFNKVISTKYNTILNFTDIGGSHAEPQLVAGRRHCLACFGYSSAGILTSSFCG